jgi:cytoplasmic FMR1 interacting protein
MIVEKCLDLLTEKLQDAHDYIGVLREGIPLFDLPPQSNHTEDCCKYYESELKHLLEFEDLKPEIFQSFREMGNIVLLLQDFSTSLAVIQPLNLLLGKKPLTFLSNRSHKNNDIVPPTTTKSLSQMNSDKNLFQYVLNHIDVTIMEFNLFRCWNDSAYTAGGPLGFYRIWSAITFLINASPYNNSDKERFGDGLTVAGCVLLNILDETKYFVTNDFCSYILRVHAHDCQSSAIDQGGYMKVGIEIECFVTAASECYHLQQVYFDMLENTGIKRV